MSSENKFWVCLFTICILGVSACIYAKSSKSTSQNKLEYELRSDVINFDYTKLSYPSQSISVGIKTDETLKERKPGYQLTEDDIVKFRVKELVDGAKIFFDFIIILMLVYMILGVIPSCVVYYILVARRKKIDKREEN